MENSAHRFVDILTKAASNSCSLLSQQAKGKALRSSGLEEASARKVVTCSCTINYKVKIMTAVGKVEVRRCVSVRLASSPFSDLRDERYFPQLLGIRNDSSPNQDAVSVSSRTQR